MCFYFQIFRTICPNLLIRIKDEIIDFFIISGEENINDGESVSKNFDENEDYHGIKYFIFFSKMSQNIIVFVLTNKQNI